MSAKRTSDPLPLQERSALMAKVRSTGNRSTEVVVQKALRAHGISGWRRHMKTVHGTPDFFFPDEKLAVFVNGCFWHGCQQCARNVPKSRRRFWIKKIDMNRRRDARVLRKLRRSGFQTMTIWEHSLRDEGWLLRLSSRLAKSGEINRVRRQGNKNKRTNLEKHKTSTTNVLTSKQKLEISMLAALPDDQIDTSDIPELPPSAWKNAVRGKFYKPCSKAQPSHEPFL